MFELFGIKLLDVSDKLYTCCSKLALLRTDVKKHSEVTLSLYRTTYSKNKNDSICPQLEKLHEQLSNDYLIDVMLEVYKAFKTSLMDLKNFIASKSTQKNKKTIENSMEVSHL